MLTPPGVNRAVVEDFSVLCSVSRERCHLPRWPMPSVVGDDGNVFVFECAHRSRCASRLDDH